MNAGTESSSHPKECVHCGGSCEEGYTSAVGLISSHFQDGEAKLLFIIPGEPTAPNPLKAFGQGMRDAQQERSFKMVGYRCRACGALQLYARE